VPSCKNENPFASCEIASRFSKSNDPEEEEFEGAGDKETGGAGEEDIIIPSNKLSPRAGAWVFTVIPEKRSTGAALLGEEGGLEGDGRGELDA